MKYFFYKTIVSAAFVFSGFSSFALPVNEIDTPERVFSIGDIHGDLDALKKILTSLKLYDPQTEKWIGGKSHLVFTGDLIDRGPKSKEVMDLVMNLEKMAAEAGGGVHTLLGNHELLVQAGLLRYVHENDYRKIGNGTRWSLIKAFRGDTPYANWFRNRNTIIRINDTIFVHAGLEGWALKYSISEINALVNQWVQYFQKVGPKPPDSTEWILDDEGPLWTRNFASYLSDEPVVRVPLDQILERFHAKRVAVGHTIVDQLDYNLDNPLYGKKVIMTDSGNSIAYEGTLTGYEYRSDEVIVHRINRKSGKIEKTLSSKHTLIRFLCRAVFWN